MKQVSLKIKSYALNLNGAVSIVNNGNLQKRILHSMLLSLGVLGLLYVLILGSMVVNIVQRKNLENEAKDLSNQVSTLELNYLSASNKIDPAFGASLGFKEQEVRYATRKALGSVKVTNNEI